MKSGLDHSRARNVIEQRASHNEGSFEIKQKFMAHAKGYLAIEKTHCVSVQ